MELIVDSEPQSMVARIVNSYSRANVKVVELGKRSVKHLSIALPVLSSEKAIRYPLSNLHRAHPNFKDFFLALWRLIPRKSSN